MMKRATRTLGLCVLLFALCSSACAPKPGTPGGTSDPFLGASKAADDIAASITLLREAAHSLEVQKLITPQEALKFIDGLIVLQSQDVKFVADIRTVKAGGGTVTGLLVPALERLRAAVSDLQSAGVLGIKNEKAKATFQTALGTIGVSIATIQAVLEAHAK